MSKTLGQLAQQFAYLNVPTGTIGEKLIYLEQPRSEIEKLYVADEYQRLTSASNLKKQGKMNWTLLLPMIVAIRPNSVSESERGSRVIDGQHKGIKYLQSGVEDPYGCLYLYHSEDYTLDQCLEAEAKIFSALNTLRKKLSKLEEIRAGVIWKEPSALWVQEVLLVLNLIVDGSFGSNEDDALELKGFYQFWFMTEDYSSDKLDKILKGFRLWKKIFNNAKHVNGATLRSMVLLQEFIDTLTNGRKLKFYDYVTKVLPVIISQDSLVKPYTDRKSNRYVLYFILEKYGEYCEAQNLASAYRIGKETIKDAEKISSKFGDPRK
jgi:hypothetical protein